MARKGDYRPLVETPGVDDINRKKAEEKKVPVSLGGSPSVAGGVSTAPAAETNQGLQQGSEVGGAQNIQNGAAVQPVATPRYNGDADVAQVRSLAPQGVVEDTASSVDAVADGTPKRRSVQKKLSNGAYVDFDLPEWAQEGDDIYYLTKSGAYAIGRKNEDGSVTKLDLNGNPLREGAAPEEYALGYSDADGNRYSAQQAMARKAAAQALSDKSVYNGNVDLLNRPKVDSAVMKDKGWVNVPDGSYSTVYSSQEAFAEIDPQTGVSTAKEILYTPILPDGTVMSPQEVTEYLDELGNKGSIVELDKPENGGKGVVIAVGEKGTDLGGDKLHEQQEILYQDADGGVEKKSDEASQKEDEDVEEQQTEQPKKTEQTEQAGAVQPLRFTGSDGVEYSYQVPEGMSAESVQKIKGTKQYTPKKGAAFTYFTDESGYPLDKNGNQLAVYIDIDDAYKKGMLAVATPYEDPKKQETKPKKEAAPKDVKPEVQANKKTDADLNNADYENSEEYKEWADWYSDLTTPEQIRNEIKVEEESLRDPSISPAAIPQREASLRYLKYALAKATANGEEQPAATPTAASSSASEYPKTIKDQSGNDVVVKNADEEAAVNAGNNINTTPTVTKTETKPKSDNGKITTDNGDDTEEVEDADKGQGNETKKPADEKSIERKVQYDLDNEEGAAIEQRTLDDLLNEENTLYGVAADENKKARKAAGVDEEGDEKFEKRRKQNQLIAAIGDVLLNLMNIWGVSKGAKSLDLTSLSGAVGEAYTTERKERETRRAQLEESFQKRRAEIAKTYEKKYENLMKRMYDSKKRSEEHGRKLEILALNQENREKIEALRQEYSLQKLAEAYEYRIKYLEEQLKNNLLTLAQKQEYQKELEELKQKNRVALKQTQGLKNR